jgi:hypothetical protein
MQDKIATDVKTRLIALAEAVNVKGIRGLAAYLGMKEGTLYAWVNRGSIGDITTIVQKIPYVNIDFLLSGTGPVLRHNAADGLTDLNLYTRAPSLHSAAVNGLTPRVEDAKPPGYCTGTVQGQLRPDQSCILALWEQLDCEQRGCLLALIRSLQGTGKQSI